MKRSPVRFGLATIALAWMAWIVLSSTSTATLDIQKAAKAAGFKADNCQYCHSDKMPKKEAHDYNDRGKWLMAEKDKRKADKVDVNWLKDYPGDKK